MKKIRVRKSRRRSRRTEKPVELESLPKLNLNAAGIDVGSREQWVAVPEGRDDRAVRSFESFTNNLYRLADWLEQCKVDTVAMESTGVYWIPIYDILEERGFQVVLVNAQDFKNVPGRKTDVADCQWLQQLHTYGLLRASFRPDAEFVQLRSYVRHRDTLVKTSASFTHRMQKALIQMNVLIHNVITDITGVTGMKIIRSIISGNHDPKKLAEHRDYRCKASKRVIAESLTGNYKPEHIWSLRQAVEQYELCQKQILETDDQIEKILTYFEETSPTREQLPAKKQRKRGGNEPIIDVRSPIYAVTGTDLTELPGLGSYSVLKIISEIGTDMSKWPSAKNFTSWITLAPRNKITGGRVISSKTRPSSNRVADTLRMAAQTISRTDTALGAFYRQKAANRGKTKAITATARKLAVLIYTLLSTGEPYRETSMANYERRHQKRSLKNLKKRAKNLGYQLVPIESEVAEAVPVGT